MTNISIDKQKSYVQQTHALENERRRLVEEMESTVSATRFAAIKNRLEAIQEEQASNAVILADMLASYLEDD